MKKIAIFVSGTGSNAKKMIRYFKSNSNIRVSLVVSSFNESPLLPFAKKHGVRFKKINKAFFSDTDKMTCLLKEIDLIVLAGFLWLVPPELITVFNKKIINIHPALLPKYGGSGMYGINVHAAVFKNKDDFSGITIHYVNERYDKGEIIFQKKCGVSHLKSPAEIQKKVLSLEHKYYSIIVESLLL